MSKLKELLKKHCPDGVEYKNLDEVVSILDNLRKPVSKDKRIKGNYPYYGANGIQDYVDNYLFDGTFILMGEDGSVINKNNSPVLNWASGKIWVNNHAHVLFNEDINILRFVFYYLQTIDVSSIVRGTPPKINQQNLRNIVVPFPPIEVQKEIVRILDEFTEKTTKLQELLHRETILRKKQYEYYRDKLLTFSNDKAQWKRLGDIAHIVMGQSPDSKSYNNKNIGLPFLQGCASFGTIYPLINTYSSDIKKIAVNGSILMSVRAPVGKLNIANTDICIGRGLCSINSNCEVSNKYIFYSLKNIIKYIADKSKGAIFDSITSDSIRNIKIPVPPLEEQERIVNILDKFDALCNDITKGLPAEIEMRKKQYEYYRDKLLTFKEKKK